jgi:hypothetical protein
MKIISEMPLENFNAWSGAVETKERIIAENKESDFEMYVEELYPDGMTDTELNDFLWFEEEFIFNILGISDDEEVDTESENAEPEEESN